MDGIVYLLHFSRRFYHARHYLGWTDDLKRRIADHLAGRGSPLIAAVLNAGIHVVIVRTWPGSRKVERLLKDLHSAPQLCPICCRRGPRKRRSPLPCSRTLRNIILHTYV